MTNTIYLQLGSNLGNSEQQLSIARKKISLNIGDIVQQSGIYTTAAWGNTNQPAFLNQVIVVLSGHRPLKVMEIILEIEANMGRVRTTKNAPRVIDIDILLYNDQIVNSRSLTIPHPLMHERRFVLVPLSEIDGNLMHPLLNKSISELLAHCTDTLEVKINKNPS